MKFERQIYDALKYTIDDWKAIVLLGIILCIASTSEETITENVYILIIISIIGLVTLFLEEGYRYLIIEETIKGNNSPPIIRNMKDLLKEGFYEVITLFIYGAILAILSYIGNNIVIYTDLDYLRWLILYIICLIIYLSFFGAAINKVLHGGKFLSAFNIIEIFKLYLKMGILQTIFLAIIGTVNLNIVVSCVLDLGILNVNHFLDYVISFFLSPAILLFVTRLMALCGKIAVKKSDERAY